MMTSNISVSYNQILGLAMQLDDKDKFLLSRELTRSVRGLKLDRLRELFKSDDISEEEIRKECEAVRQELYDRRNQQ